MTHDKLTIVVNRVAAKRMLVALFDGDDSEGHSKHLEVDLSKSTADEFLYALKRAFEDFERCQRNIEPDADIQEPPSGLFSTWGLVCQCLKESRAVSASRGDANKEFLKDGWGKINGKWYCPKCLSQKG